MVKNILILGSKPPGKLPKVNVDKIFSSNGSAELAKIYIDRIRKVDHTCVIGARSFAKIDEIKKRVINSEPNEVIIRDYEDKFSYILNLFNKETNFIKFSKRKQFIYQKNFFKSGFASLFLAEIRYERNLYNKIKHVINGFLFHGFMGVSSGFFSLLYAAEKYPSSNLILSGLSFEGGDHYYNSGQMTINRGLVDAYLFKFLSNRIKNRILIFDKEISHKMNVRNLDEEELIFNK